ncbi:hypothetical protein SNEBB_005138 [Seison nebaliae]|nr:hypothetical protein SNEBB_005138 [Seison nebaliae]
MEDNDYYDDNDDDLDSSDLSSEEESGEELNDQNWNGIYYDIDSTSEDNDDEEERNVEIYDKLLPLIEKEEAEEGQTDHEKYNFDSDNCVICLKSFNNDIAHRMCALECGHVYGHNCITNWKQNKGRIVYRCCRCSIVSYPLTIRNIYCGITRPIDTTERDALEEELKTRKEAYRNLLFDYQSLEHEKIALEHLYKEEQRKNEIRIRKLDEQSCEKLFKQKSIINLKLDGSLETRFIQFDQFDQRPIISQRFHSPIRFMQQWGIKIADLTRGTIIDTISLHTTMIRDMQINQLQPKQLMTVADDSTIKIFSSKEKNGKITFEKKWVNSPFTSCCWSNVNENLFLIGDEEGKIHLFDKLFLKYPIASQETVGSSGPIIRIINSKWNEENLFLATSFTGDIFSIDEHQLGVDKKISETLVSQRRAEFDRNRYDITSTRLMEDNIFVSYRATETRDMVDYCHYELNESGVTDEKYRFGLKGISVQSSAQKNFFISRSLATLIHPNKSSLGIYVHGDEATEELKISPFNNEKINYTWKWKTKGFVHDLALMHSDENILQKIFAITNSNLYIYDFDHSDKWDYLIS